MPKPSLLAVFAHPDDEIAIAPLLAKYAHEGHPVYLLVLTAGERGYREHAGIPAGEPLAAARAQELACSAAALGLTEYRLLRFPDQGFLPTDYATWEKAAAAVRHMIDLWRADVVVTWGPEGGTGHPDHRAAHSIVAQAFQQRALLQYTPRKLYSAIFAVRADHGTHEWAASTSVSREFITTHVDCRAYVPAAHRAIDCHRSQWSAEIASRVHGMHDAESGHVLLRLAYSSVATAFPETDLFAGL
jgi:LmbE family N-acetylglucosaminyl deacetylase